MAAISTLYFVEHHKQGDNFPRFEIAQLTSSGVLNTLDHKWSKTRPKPSTSSTHDLSPTIPDLLVENGFSDKLSLPSYTDELAKHQNNKKIKNPKTAGASQPEDISIIVKSSSAADTLDDNSVNSGSIDRSASINSSNISNIRNWPQTDGDSYILIDVDSNLIDTGQQQQTNNGR